MKTIIQTEIKGDRWVATTPHQSGLTSEAVSEAGAIQGLIDAIRQQIKDAGDKGVTWKADAKPGKDKDKVTRQVTGCWPPIITETKPDKPAKRKDVTDG